MNLQNQINLKEIIHDLLFNIELLDDQLRDIFELVQLSRIGVLSKAILNSNETKFVLDRLEEQNILINNTDQIYEFLNIETYHEKTKIIIVVKIPMFLPGKFDYIQIVTIPNRHKVILTQFNLVVQSKSITLGINNPCPIIENYRICKIQELTNVTGDGCIDNALRGFNASCPYIEQKDETDIKPINGHTLVIRNAIQPVQINSSCNIQARKLTGTLLITYRNCYITINGAKYDDERTRDNHDITIVPTFGINFQATAVFSKPDLHQVNLLRIENRNHISKLRRDHTSLQHTTSGLLSVFAALIIGLIIWTKRGNMQRSREVNLLVNTRNVPSSFSTDRLPETYKIRDESSIGGEQLSNASPVMPEDKRVAPKPEPRFTF